MTERDFDKIFQDNIGDELPFDFRPDDWIAAEQELDKLMPTVAPVPRFLTWHKWAIAATVLLLGSQLFLLKELRNVKQEVVSLHQQNGDLKATEKVGKNAPSATQSIVIQHDTIVKTIIVEVPKSSNTLEKELKERGIEKKNFDDFVAHQNAINDRNEAAYSNNKGDKTKNSKPNLAAKNSDTPLLNTDKTPLQIVENATKINAQKDSILNGKKDLIANELNNKQELKDNKQEGVKDNKQDDLKDNKQGGLIEINKDKSVLNALPNTLLTTVKSMNRAKNWLNDEAFDFIPMSKPVIIKPIAQPNGWEISASTLFLATNEHFRPQPKPQSRDDSNRDAAFSVGANLRLSYNIRNNIRLSAEADFWRESHTQDSMNRPPRERLPLDYQLVDVEQKTRSLQLRIGADYKFRQIIGLQPFIGIGLAYQKQTDDEFEYKFKKAGKITPVREPNESGFNKPISLSIRAGVEGKIYRRLGWSLDVNAQGRNTLSSHIGLKYAL